MSKSAASTNTSGTAKSRSIIDLESQTNAIAKDVLKLFNKSLSRFTIKPPFSGFLNFFHQFLNYCLIISKKKHRRDMSFLYHCSNSENSNQNFERMHSVSEPWFVQKWRPTIANRHLFPPIVMDQESADGFRLF